MLFIDEKVELPKYTISRVFEQRDRVMSEALLRFIGRELTPEEYGEMVTGIYHALNGIKKSVLFDSLSEYAGRRLDEHELKMMAWRIAGNASRMRAGEKVTSGSFRHTQEWSPAQIVSVRRDNTRSRSYIFTFRILAGAGCPRRPSKRFSRGFCRFLSRRIGFTNRRGTRPFSHPAEMVNLRLWLYLDPKLSSYSGRPDFSSMTASAGSLQWNRVILRMRFRQDWSCPYDYTHPCFRCHVGYVDCPAATHRYTYEIEEESNEEREEASPEDAAMAQDGSTSGAT